MKSRGSHAARRARNRVDPSWRGASTRLVEVSLVEQVVVEGVGRHPLVRLHHAVQHPRHPLRVHPLPRPPRPCQPASTSRGLARWSRNAAQLGDCLTKSDLSVIADTACWRAGRRLSAKGRGAIPGHAKRCRLLPLCPAAQPLGQWPNATCVMQLIGRRPPQACVRRPAPPPPRSPATAAGAAAASAGRRQSCTGSWRRHNR